MHIKKLNIIFAGNDEISLEHLKSLYYSSYKIKAVITKKINQKSKKKKNKIKIFSTKKKIPILSSIKLTEKKFENNIRTIKADILIISSYGTLFPKKIIKLFPKGGINIHPSLLPRWRGAAPIQRAILSGDKKTGVSIIKIDSTLDTGKIIFQLPCPIYKYDTTKTLCIRIIPISLQAMYQALKIITSKKKINYKKQEIDNSIYAKKIIKTETKIKWNQNINQIDRAIRAFNPWPYCYFILKNKIIKIIQASKKNIHHNILPGTIIKITKKEIQVAVKKGILNLEILQISGKKPMHIQLILNSKKNWFLPKTILI